MNSHVGDRERLIALLAALADPPRAAALPTDDPLLMTVARHHRLSPLLSITCGDTLPSSLAEACRRDRVVTAARNMILGQVAEECLRALAAAGIPTIVLKGLDYETRLYQVVGARPTADVDLLVPEEKRRDAFGVLDRLGFEPRAAAPGFDDPDYHEVAWTRAGAEIDLHMALAPLARCRIDYAAVWAAAGHFQLGQTKALDLGRHHGAVFHALHMAIDHFDVPAISLVDLTRLLPSAEDLRVAQTTARLWRCGRALGTAVALTAELIPSWARGMQHPLSAVPLQARRVLHGYGTTSPLPRPEQLLRKLMHLDSFSDAVRYMAIQSRRIAFERIERRFRRRSARRRLGL